MSQTNMAGFISGFDVTVSQAEINEEAGGTISTSTLSDTHQGTPQRPSPKAALAFMDVKEIIGASYGEVGVFQCVKACECFFSLSYSFIMYLVPDLVPSYACTFLANVKAKFIYGQRG